MTTPGLNSEQLNAIGQNYLPGLLGIQILAVTPGEVQAELPVHTQLLAPNGYLHAGSVVTLADTACGYGTMANLPEGAHSFTTIELKSNHLGTAREGVIQVTAKLQHGGRTTQVWDAVVSYQGKTIALFRCTQMLLYPRN